MGKHYRLLREPRRREGQALHGATNDSDEYVPTIEMLEGYPIVYSCEESFDPAATTFNSVNIAFDYEVTIRTQHVDTVEENLRELEWSVLWNVAQRIGLKIPCELDNQQLDRRNRRTLSLTQRRRLLTVGGTYVSSLNSQPPDSIDSANDYCVSTDVDSSNEFCVAMKGMMTAMHTGSDTAAAVETYLQDQIESTMKLSKVIVKDVSQVVYQGNRTRAIARFQSSTGASKGLSDLGVGVVVAAAGVAVVLIALFARWTVKRSFEKELDTMDTTPTDIDDNPSMEDPPTRPRRIVNVAEEKRPGLESHRSLKVSKVNQAPVYQFSVGKTVDQSAARPLPPHPDIPPSGAFPVVVVSAADDPSKSTSLKRKRHKKKKKKKSGRHSLKPSRSASEMETIHEASEEDREGDGYLSEDGSEYSSDDNVRMSRSSSADSLFQSEPSPHFSTRHEMDIDSPKHSGIPRLPPPWV